VLTNTFKLTLTSVIIDVISSSQLMLRMVPLQHSGTSAEPPKNVWNIQ